MKTPHAKCYLESAWEYEASLANTSNTAK